MFLYLYSHLLQSNKISSYLQLSCGILIAIYSCFSLFLFIIFLSVFWNLKKMFWLMSSFFQFTAVTNPNLLRIGSTYTIIKYFMWFSFYYMFWLLIIALSSDASKLKSIILSYCLSCLYSVAIGPSYYINNRMFCQLG
jgi:hypothetical protein